MQAASSVSFWAYRTLPSPPMRAVISSMRSRGNGGALSGRMAILMSFIGLSSAATRLELSAPQRLQRWMIAPGESRVLSLGGGPWAEARPPFGGATAFADPCSFEHTHPVYGGPSVSYRGELAGPHS